MRNLTNLHQWSASMSEKPNIPQSQVMLIPSLTGTVGFKQIYVQHFENHSTTRYNSPNPSQILRSFIAKHTTAMQVYAQCLKAHSNERDTHLTPCIRSLPSYSLRVLRHTDHANLHSALQKHMSATWKLTLSDLPSRPQFDNEGRAS